MARRYRERTSAIALVLALGAQACGAPTRARVAELAARPSAGSSAPPAVAAPPPAPPMAVAPPAAERRFAVAAEHASAAAAAAAVLERGGSAADAAVAALLVAGVVQPASSGLGGGGFALYRDGETQRVVAIDFREAAPIGLRPGAFEPRPVPEARRGELVGVPGELAGLAELYRRWGKLAWADLVRPAAELAEAGFPVSDHMHRALRWGAERLGGQERWRAVFAPKGALLRAGERARNPSLGATLRRIAADGAAAFYAGELGDDAVETARRMGGRLARIDLGAYRAVERPPLALRWEGHDVFVAPPPAAGGLVVLETLSMHGRAELAALPAQSGAYLHLLAETFRGAVADQIRAVGDPAFLRMDAAALFAPERLRARRARIHLERTLPAAGFAPPRPGGTTHLSVVDAAGNVVSVSSSIGGLFGARLMTAGGYVLNDALSDFAQRRVDRRFGVTLHPNAPRGGARPVSQLAPAIVVAEGGALLALGASGGERIGGAVTQVLLGRLVHGLSPRAAVEAARIHTPVAGGLLLEPGMEDALVADLRSRGELVRTEAPDYGAVGLVETDGAGGLEAVADARKGGVALVGCMVASGVRCPAAR
jgi:gamma-glutamyltranspeptidase/glutathione hydrolase